MTVVTMLTRTILAITASLAACSPQLPVGGSQDTPVIVQDGLEYKAQFREYSKGIILEIQVRNPSDEELAIDFLGDCRVATRLYDRDTSIAWDGAALIPCFTVADSVRIPPRSTHALVDTANLRSPDREGRVLEAGRYKVVAEVFTNTRISLEAGELILPEP